MKKIIVIVVCMICCTPIFSQGYHNRLLEQKTMWDDTTRVYNVLDEKLDTLFDYLKDRYVPLVNYAKVHYDMTMVFHAELSSNNSIIEISLADNDFPLDLYYTDAKSKIKLHVETYQGEVQAVDTRLTTMMRGLAQKQAKAFRYILKQQPDLIFEVFDSIFACYFYVKKDMIYFYDYYHMVKGSFIDYSSITGVLLEPFLKDRIEYWYDTFSEGDSVIREEFFVQRNGVFQCPAAEVVCNYADHYRANTKATVVGRRD